MIKIDNNSNNLMISHIADIDGMGSVILSKLIDNMDILLINTDEVRETLNNLLKNNNYEKIYMCDLSIPDDLADVIDGKLPIKHFDHHPTNTYVSKYNWSTVIPIINHFKPSGTSLYYDYLVSTSSLDIIHSEKIKVFVEAIRSYDTWDFINTKNLLGKHMTMLFSMLGPLKFIDRFYNRLVNNETFELNEFEKELIELKQNEMNDYIDVCDENLIIADFAGYKVGISISESYRSELGNVLSSRHKELDFILIVDFHRKSFSMRTTNDIHLGEISKKLGGGGHAKAAGFPMNEENTNEILNLIKGNFKYK